MDTIADAKLDQLLSSGDGQPVTPEHRAWMPEHRAWMNGQIRATLEKKQRGEMQYTPLDEARREFGLDAS